MGGSRSETGPSGHQKAGHPEDDHPDTGAVGRPRAETSGYYRTESADHPSVGATDHRHIDPNIDPHTDPLIDLMLNCLHQDSARFPREQLDALSEDSRKRLFELAAEHRVVPLMYDRLTKAGVEWDTSMFHAYASAVARNNLRYFGELRTLLGHLGSRDIPVIALKGIHLSEEVYENPGLREMNDIDIMVRTEHLKETWEILTGMGYQSDTGIHYEAAGNYQVPTIIRRSHHLPPLLKEDVAAIEIHWNITRPGKPYHIEPWPLWQQARRMTIAGQEAMVLSPEDLLLHLCVHTSYQHIFSFGMRPFCDIAETVRRFDDRLDLDVVIRRAEERNWNRGVFLALELSRDFTGAAIPDEVLNRLRPDGYHPEMAATARAQILTKKEESAAISPSMVQFAAQKGALTKIRTAWQRIFLPEDVMVTKYPIRPGSPRRYLYYAVRLWQLLTYHTGRMIRMSRGDANLSGIVRRKQSLSRWMHGE